MQKQAPSTGRILIAVGFALSCFGLLLFLWIAFGGPIPLKPKSYRITAFFPEGTQLAVESDVRIGGVSVGKVKTLDLAPNDPEHKLDGQDLTEAVVEIEPEFAPLTTDARAILRQKTLLGETFVELTSGSQPGSTDDLSLGEAAANATDADSGEVEPVPEDGFLGCPTTEFCAESIAQTRDATQIDEIFNALDDETRRAFQLWLQRSGAAIQGRGLDLNDAFGNLGPFLGDASDLVDILHRQRVALKGVVRDTGEVFEALTENEAALAGTITNSNATFEALASEERALAETIQILPTFQRESRLTFERLDAFAQNTHPLVRELLPVANDISPTLRNIRRLSPHLESLFRDLDVLVDVSKRGLPALRDLLREARPLLDALDPFLANLNPVIRYLRFNRHTVSDFLSGPPAALAGTLTPRIGQPSARHALRQISYMSTETLAVHPERIETNRGNGYLKPLILNAPVSASNGIFPNWDCDHIDGERTLGDGGDPEVGYHFAPCIVADQFSDAFGGSQYPRLFADP